MDVLKATAMSYITTNASYVTSLGYTLDDMLISCYFNGISCDSSDFYQIYTFEYGNCYIFNHNYGNGTSLSKVSKSGPRSGLQLELFAGYPGW